MKKITLILLIIVSLILPQTVEGAEDEPFNPWTSCARNFVKYSNKGEYCYILEVTGSINDIQYILAHDVANRNPLITTEDSGRRFLNLSDTTRYEVYYSDKVQSLTGLGNIFSGDKIELTIVRPNKLKIEVIRTNFGLYNIDGQLIYDANYYSDVTEVVKEPDWLTDNRLTGNEYILAVFKVLDETSPYYNHYIGMALEDWKNYLNNGKKIYVPKVTDDMYDPWGFDNAFIYTDDVRLEFCDLGLTLEDSDFSSNSYDWSVTISGRDNFYTGSTKYFIIGLKDYFRKGIEPHTYNELALYNWSYGANMVYSGVEGTTPTPIVKPTAAPLVEDDPINGIENGVFGLGQTIKRIFLPSGDVLYNEVTASKDLLLDKLHIDLDSFSPDRSGRPQNVTMTFYGQNVTLLDFEQIESLASQATTPINIVRVFIYVFALWGVIKYVIDYFNNRGGGSNA